MDNQEKIILNQLNMIGLNEDFKSMRDQRVRLLRTELSESSEFLIVSGRIKIAKQRKLWI